VLNQIAPAQIVGGWIGAVTLAAAIAVVAGADISRGSFMLYLATAAMPAATLLALWHRTPELTVAEILHPNPPSSGDRIR
jgi:hypothetical protein